MHQRYRNCKQLSRSVEEYTKEFCYLCAENNISESENLVSRYIYGLNVEIKEKLELQTTWTMDEVVNLALRVELHIDRKTKNTRKASNPSFCQGNANRLNCTPLSLDHKSNPITYPTTKSIVTNIRIDGKLSNDKEDEINKKESILKKEEENNLGLNSAEIKEVDHELEKKNERKNMQALKREIVEQKEKIFVEMNTVKDINLSNPDYLANEKQDLSQAISCQWSVVDANDCDREEELLMLTVHTNLKEFQSSFYERSDLNGKLIGTLVDSKVHYNIFIINNTLSSEISGKKLLINGFGNHRVCHKAMEKKIALKRGLEQIFFMA